MDPCWCVTEFKLGKVQESVHKNPHFPTGHRNVLHRYWSRVAGGRRCQQILRPLLPLKLKQSCRITVRRQFKNNIIMNIATLPLPRQLKDYLIHGDALSCTVVRRQRKAPQQQQDSHGVSVATPSSSAQEDISPEIEFPFERIPWTRWKQVFLLIFQLYLPFK